MKTEPKIENKMKKVRGSTFDTCSLGSRLQNDISTARYSTLHPGFSHSIIPIYPPFHSSSKDIELIHHSPKLELISKKQLQMNENDLIAIIDVRCVSTPHKVPVYGPTCAHSKSKNQLGENLQEIYFLDKSILLICEIFRESFSPP